MLTASSVVCRRCPLANCGRKSIVDGSGPIPSVLMCIAEAPGRDEDAAGTPLIGQSGKLLRSTIAEIASHLGLYEKYGSRLPIFYTNVNRCRPPDNRTPTDKEVRECLPWLQMEVDEVQPKALLLLGSTAKSVVGDLTTDAEFFGTWHPAYILRQRSKLDVWKEDVEDAIRFAFGLPNRIDPDNDSSESDNLGSDSIDDTVPPDVETDEIRNNQFTWGDPDYNAPFLSADTEFDDLEEHVGTVPVGWSASDGLQAIFRTDEPPNFRHIYVHRADADLRHLRIDPDRLDSYDDTMEMAYPLQQRYGWPFLGLKRSDHKGLAQTIPNPPVVWKHMLKSDLLRVYVPNDTVFKSGPRKGQQKPGKWKKNVKFSEVYASRTRDASEYGATDAYGTAKLAEGLVELWEDPENAWAKEYYYQVEKPLIPVLLQMEETGVEINRERLEAAGVVIDKQREETQFRLQAIPQFATINLGSTKQMGPVLLDMHLIDGKRTETGQLCVDEKSILHAFGVESELELPQTDEGKIARDLLQWREMGKLRSTYVNAILSRLDPASRIHPRFNSTGAYTNRLSSSDPNAQNIPARTEIGMAIRRAFVARRGCSLVGGDLSQFQLRIFAKYTHDPIFMDAYVHGKDRGCAEMCKCQLCDIHQRFTDLVNSWGYHVERSSHTGGPSMKNGVFATLYGVAGRKLANTIGIPETEADKFLRQMKLEVPSISGWANVASQELASIGYVDTLLGWRMYFPDYGSVVNKWHAEAIRQAACGKVQGSEGGLVKVAMRRVYEELMHEYGQSRPPMILQIHDEIWTETADEIADEVKQLMKETVESTMKKWMEDIPVVFDAKSIKSWDEGK